MKLIISSGLTGDKYGVINITVLSNILEQILDIIIPTLEPNITFFMFSGKFRYDFLKNNNTKEFEDYIANIYNSSINEHTLYIMKELYYDNKNRTLVDCKNYLNNLTFSDCIEITERQDLTMRDKYLILGMIELFPGQLARVNELFIDDKDIVLTAIKRCANLLRFASNRLKRDKEIVLTAVTKHGTTLKYASNELKGNKEIVLMAVIQNGYALQYASRKLRNDKEIVLAAINNKNDALRYTSKVLRRYKEY